MVESQVRQLSVACSVLQDSGRLPAWAGLREEVQRSASWEAESVQAASELGRARLVVQGELAAALAPEPARAWRQHLGRLEARLVHLPEVRLLVGA